jgi:hypothetical protein
MAIKRFLVIPLMLLALAVAGTAEAGLIGATVNITAGNGFGFNNCKDAAVVSRTVTGSGELAGSDWTGVCVGYYAADITDNLITLSPLEWGNYDTATFDLHVVSGTTITGASFVGYTHDFFDPDTYGTNDTNFFPVVTFGASDVHIVWDSSPTDQFAFNGPYNNGTAPFGTALFEVTSVQVPEPGSTMFLLGIGLAGLRAWRKR